MTQELSLEFLVEEDEAQGRASFISKKIAVSERWPKPSHSLTR